MELFKTKVLQAVNKYAYNADAATKEDLIQSCYLALLAHGEVSHPGEAATICRNTIVKEFRERDFAASLSDPKIFCRADAYNSKSERRNFLTQELLEHLTDNEYWVIKFRYGIGVEKEFSIMETAKLMKKSKKWVELREESAMKKLKELK